MGTFIVDTMERIAEGFGWSRSRLMQAMAGSYLLSAEKRWNDHALSLVTFGSPTERAQQGASTEEAYWLANSHYYNPNWGRFISADNQLSTGDFSGLNLFAYCGNNPVNRVDPTGEAWWHWAVAAGIVVAAAAAVVITAGGAAAALSAVALVANGVAVSSTATTVAAGVFIGSASALAISAYGAALESNSAEEFAGCRPRS